MIARMLAFFAATAVAAVASAGQSLPPRAGNLNDYAHVVDAASAFDIVRMTEQLQRSTEAELVLVTLRSVGGNEANDYAEVIRTEWGLGGTDGENHPVVVVLYVVQDGAFGFSYNDVARPYLPHEALDEAFDRARPEIQSGQPGRGMEILVRSLVELLGG